MKRIFLALAAGAFMVFNASADRAAVCFGTMENPDSTITNVAKMETNLPSEPGSSAIYDNEALKKAIKVEGCCTVTFDPTAKCALYTSGKSYVQFDQGKWMLLTPEEGVTFNKITMATLTWGTGRGLTVEEGMGTVTNPKSGFAYAVWEGEVSQPLKFTQGTAYSYARVMTMIIEYTVAGSSAIHTVGIDSEGAVKYYDLKGNAVEQPAKGGLYIRTQGNTATKVIVE